MTRYMNKNIFENDIFRNWAEYFGCPIETVQQDGTMLLSESKYDEDKVIALWYIGKHTFVQLDPAYYSRLDELVKKLPPKTSLAGDHIEKAFGSETILARDAGLAHYLFPQDLPNYIPPHPFILRQLTEADAEVMSALHLANTPEDVDEGCVEVTHQVAFGCFHGKILIAAASGYERAGFMDIGVLTHPEFRKKCLGRSVVGALCKWSIEHDIIAQYRHNIVSTGSQNTAKSLHFQMYFKSEGISLR